MADGPAGFTQDYSCPALLRVPLGFGGVARTGLSPSAGQLSGCFRYAPSCRIAALQPPEGRNLPGLGSSPVARRYWGNHCYFLFLRVLRCFSSPRSPPALAGWRALSPPGFPIRTSPCQRPCAPRRGFSQLVTSFIACESLGIHRTPFLTPSSGMPRDGPRRRRAPALRGGDGFSSLGIFSFIASPPALGRGVAPVTFSLVACVYSMSLISLP